MVGGRRGGLGLGPAMPPLLKRRRVMADGDGARSKGAEEKPEDEGGSKAAEEEAEEGGGGAKTAQAEEAELEAMLMTILNARKKGATC